MVLFFLFHKRTVEGVTAVDWKADRTRGGLPRIEARPCRRRGPGQFQLGVWGHPNRWRAHGGPVRSCADLATSSHATTTVPQRTVSLAMVAAGSVLSTMITPGASASKVVEIVESRPMNSVRLIPGPVTVNEVS